MKMRADARSLNVWCAACSTGQEPYSLALLLRERFPVLAGWDVRILATDISVDALDVAARGVYSHLEVNRGLPARLLVKHFEKTGFDWQLSSAVKSMVAFDRLNLIEPWPSLPQMDLVLMRNVLIYFDADTKRDVLRRLRGVLRADATLVLGSAETTIYLDDAFEPARPGTYGLKKETRPCS
jgi:chemotaxis protein methyltransferase CheR